MTSKQFPVPIPAYLTWRLLFAYDNTGNGDIVREFHSKIYQSYDASVFTDTLTTYSYTEAQKQGIDVTAGGAFEAVSASVGYNFENSSEVQNYLSTQTQTQTDHTYTSEYDELHKYTIGPGGRLSVYQLYFVSPGTEYACNAVRTDKQPDVNFNITVTVRQWKVLRNITVAYGDDEWQKPPNSILEINGSDTDINDGFGGKYVWLVPEFGYGVITAITGLSIRIQSGKDGAKDDLAKGAGGKYRYLDLETNPYQSRKIIDVRLLRSKSAQGPYTGWDGITKDINQGRGGDYLYIMWKTILVSSAEVTQKAGKKTLVRIDAAPREE